MLPASCTGAVPVFLTETHPVLQVEIGDLEREGWCRRGGGRGVGGAWPCFTTKTLRESQDNGRESYFLSAP